jgi:hypothetical protein
VKLFDKKSLLAVALVAGGMTHGPLVQAGPTGQILDLSFPNNHADLFPAGGDNMHIFLNNGVTTSTSHVRAGMFSGSADRDNSTFDVDTLVLDGENVLVYCVDILQYLEKSSTEYDVNMIDLGSEDIDTIGVRRDFGRMLTFLGAMNHVLYEDYGLDFGDKNWLNPTPGGWMAGAIQVGIWESLYEKEESALSILDAADGINNYFSAIDVDLPGQTLLDAAFTRMGTATPLDVTQVVWLSTDEGQDLLADPVDVPVPAPLALLFGGLGILVLRSRRQAAATR